MSYFPSDPFLLLGEPFTHNHYHPPHHYHYQQQQPYYQFYPQYPGAQEPWLQQSPQLYSLDLPEPSMHNRQLFLNTQEEVFGANDVSQQYAIKMEPLNVKMEEPDMEIERLSSVDHDHSFYHLPLPTVQSPIQPSELHHNISPRPFVDFDVHPSIDTALLCRQVLEFLKESKISQVKVAETILRRGQGTLSDLLHRPKPWNFLSGKGRETYIRLYQWMQLSREERMEVVHMTHPEASRIMGMTSRSAHCGKNRKIGSRTVFSKEQLEELTRLHLEDPQLKAGALKEVTKNLGLHHLVVLNFFENRRRRHRLQSQKY